MNNLKELLFPPDQREIELPQDNENDTFLKVGAVDSK